ncbi:MAG: hypothetical protein PHH54_01520 [Candidatus Nanoarchaeia archaeon]|nr:hypothetical protein [Candidatus Nanoarchaeia archaeon]MDD5740643.1 hypothetical protein [Candidatus Nanoarchaeia archaeon]
MKTSDTSERFNMRIDENGNIEVECNEDYEKGIINDYGITSDPSQIVYTKDLIHCVGLGLVADGNNIRKRGLMHVHHNPKFNQKSARDFIGNMILPERKVIETNSALESFLRDFQKSENGVLFSKPSAIMVYVRSLLIDRTKEKIILRDDITGKLNEREIEDINQYGNLMADYIKKWLETKNISLYASDARTNKKMHDILNMREDPKETFSKQFALKHDKIAIGMYNKSGIMLNRKDYEAAFLELNI